MSLCRKKGEPLDFNNLPELPPDALKIADAKDITLKSWGTKAPTLLPEDLHYKVFFIQLPCLTWGSGHHQNSAGEGCIDIDLQGIRQARYWVRDHILSFRRHKSNV